MKKNSAGLLSARWLGVNFLSTGPLIFLTACLLSDRILSAGSLSARFGTTVGFVGVPFSSGYPALLYFVQYMYHSVSKYKEGLY